MQYIQPFNLKCYDALKEAFTELFTQMTGDNYVVDLLKLPEDIENLFVNEMAERGLHDPTGWLAFKKRNVRNVDPNNWTVHMDLIRSTELIHASIAIPIDNVVDAPMVWFEGEHDWQIVIPEGLDIKYAVPVWKDVSQVKLRPFDVLSPSICRVGVPHDTWSNLDGSYRQVVTTRFACNPTFEELCEKLS